MAPLDTLVSVHGRCHSPSGKLLVGLSRPWKRELSKFTSSSLCQCRLRGTSVEEFLRHSRISFKHIVLKCKTFKENWRLEQTREILCFWCVYLISKRKSKIYPSADMCRPLKVCELRETWPNYCLHSAIHLHKRIFH